MTDKAKVVLKGLIELSDNEREQVIEEARGYKRKTFSDRGYINESIEKAQRTLGPTSANSCPCCGR